MPKPTIADVLVDTEDAWLLERWRWQIKQPSRCRTWYVCRNVQVSGVWQTLRLHRVVLGVDDPKVHVDHINMNGLDCRRANLRAATQSQNQHNRTKYANNTSGYKGVYWDKRRGCWRAGIRFEGRTRHIGLYATAEEAYAAYCARATELHQDFARF
jgi:hypothetical protein